MDEEAHLDQNCDIANPHDAARDFDGSAGSSSSGNVSVVLPGSSENIKDTIDDGLKLSPVASSISITSLRSWTASISTASSEDFEYDNYADDDTEPNGDRSTSTSPFFNVGAGRAGSAEQKRGRDRKGNTVAFPANNLPSGPNSTVIRLLSPSLTIAQSLLEIGAEPRISSPLGASVAAAADDCPESDREVVFGVMQTLTEPAGDGPPGEDDASVGLESAEGESRSQGMASLAVPESMDDNLTGDEMDDPLADEEARMLNLARFGCRVQFDSDVINNEKVGTSGGSSDAAKNADPARREIRCTPDWSDNAAAGDHLWAPTSASGEWCYFDDCCTRQGPRMKCAGCQMICHASCIPTIMERNEPLCKPTFYDVDVRQYREQTKINHHWVHSRMGKGKCKQCGKSLQGKLSFGSKESVAVCCAWCKASYHNKESCFNPERLGDECSLGAHRSIVVPPSWIIKLPQKGNFKSSLRKALQKKKRASKKVQVAEEPRTFIIKPIPTANITPVLVFINPKSGGNQGAKLLQKFQWLLNPRQVFDLTQGGPRMGLELFRNVPQLRVLACGGDGTVGWVLSVLDQISFAPPPAVGVLPLGTGNDLARSLGWGGGYTDEPIGKILENIGTSDTVLLDRWNLNVTPNTSVTNAADGKDNLPLNVVNNYFSLGVDAHIALEFHEAREAHPEKFNSRLRNKMFYGQAGGKDLLKRKWKGLAEFVKLECDGKDLTPKLKEHKVHAIVFLNINSYGGGTHPWNKSGGQFEPSTDDGMIEVVGLTTYQLPLLQAGGHGTCIAQCKSATIVTSKTIPMQVDGEACKLKPSTIELSLLNTAVMLAKKKPGRANVPLEKLESLNIQLAKISMADYEQHHYDKDLLKKSAVDLGMLELPVTDLEQLRNLINKYTEDQPDSPKLSSDWCFIDSCTAERFFRIDRAQENLHFLTDIATDCLFVLEAQECPTMPQTPQKDPQTPQLNSLESIDGDSSNDGVIVPSNVQLPSRSPSKPDTATVMQKSDSHDLQGPPQTNPKLQQRGVSADNFGIDQNLDQVVNFKSFHERLFGLNEDAFGFSNLLEKTTDSLIKASKTGNLALLKELHYQGYSLLSIDATGQTALHHGARGGHKDIVRYLISYAPNTIINMIDNESGQTALHKAVANKHRSICYMLVAGGANLNIQDQKGQTVRMLAAKMDDYELESYLENQEKFHLNDFRSNT